MSRIRLVVSLFSVIATGCASYPPPKVLPEVRTVDTTVSPADQQPQDVETPPAAEAKLVVRAPTRKGLDIFFPWTRRSEAVDQSPRQIYEALSILPQAKSRVLRFHLGRQTFEYIEDGEVMLSGPIASGKSSSPTPTGLFAVLSKEQDKVSSRYTNEIGTPAWMPYSLQFHGNYFVHEGWLPGYAASHGCIRVGHYAARLLFERMKIGDPVIVSR